MTRLYLILSAVALVLISGAFFVGRWTAPVVDPQTEYLTKVLPPLVITKVQNREVVKWRKVVETKTPDGAVTTTTEETEKAAEHATETPPPPEKVVPVIAALPPPAPAKPDWHVAIGTGLTFDSAYALVYSLSVERRVLGPVFLGGEVTTQFTKNWSAFIKLGVEF